MSDGDKTTIFLDRHLLVTGDVPSSSAGTVPENQPEAAKVRPAQARPFPTPDYDFPS
jgi:hypothetical protein